MNESRTLAWERVSAREQGEKRVDSAGKEGRFQGGEVAQAKRISLEEVEGSMSGSQSSPEGSVESWFHCKPGQT